MSARVCRSEMRVPVARICGSAIDLRRLLLELRGLDVALVRRGRAFLLRAEIQPCARHERAEARVVNGADERHPEPSGRAVHPCGSPSIE